MGRFFFCILFLSTLVGCATTPSVSYVDAQRSRSWQQFSNQNSQIDTFKLSGRVSVISQGESHQVTVNWKYNPSEYSLKLTGPFHAGGAIIHKSSEGLTLSMNDETPYRAISPETLMEQALGWSAPVSALRYWILGIPMPDAPFEASVDELGQPHLMRQHGWSIIYDRFQSGLPTRLAMESENARLKIIIQKWEIDSD